MELRQIKLFVAVAEEGHFGRAATRMFISQPALSQHIRRLERELGVQLFDRSSRQVRLTAAGDAFLQVARRMSLQLAEATMAARRADAGELGSLALGVHVPAVAPVLSILLRQWCRLRPAVGPRLTSGQPGELVDLVRRGDLDVALVAGPITDRSVASTLVLEDQMVVVLPADHPLAGKREVSIGDLNDERFVVVSRNASPSVHDRFIALCGADGFSPDVAAEVEDSDLVPLAVAAGLGVGLAARVSMAVRAIPGVICRPLDDPMAVVPLVAVSARDGAGPQTAEFLRLIADLRRCEQLDLPRIMRGTELGSEEIDITDAALRNNRRLLQPAV